MVTPAFAQYLASHGIRYQAPAAPQLKLAAPAAPWRMKNLPVAAAAATKAPSPPDVISTILDLIDRPRRAVTQTQEAVADAGFDAADGTFDFGKSLGNVASAPFRGLFSQNKSDQETGSELMKHTVSRTVRSKPSHDLARALFGRDYTDKAVDAALKTQGANIGFGVGGFLLDVASDPLSAVPIPVDKIVKLARGGKNIGEAILKGAAKTDQAAPEPVAKLLELTDGNPEMRVDANGEVTRYVGGRPATVAPGTQVPKGAAPVDAPAASPAGGLVPPTAVAPAPRPDPMAAVRNAEPERPTWTKADTARLKKVTDEHQRLLNEPEVASYSKHEMARYNRALDQHEQEMERLVARQKAAKAKPVAERITAPASPAKITPEAVLLADRVAKQRIGPDLKPDPAEYRFESDAAKNTAEGIGRGKAVRPGIYENHKESELLRDLSTGAAEHPAVAAYVKPDGKPLVNPDRAATKRQVYLDARDVYSAMNAQNGVAEHLTWRNAATLGTSTETADAYLHFGNVVEELAKHDPEMVDFLFFHPVKEGGAFVPQVAAGAARLVAGHDLDRVMETVLSAQDEFGRAIKSNFLTGTKTSRWRGAYSKDGRFEGIDPARVEKIGDKGHFNIHADPADMRARLAAALKQARPALQALSAKNAESYAARVAEDATVLTGEQMDRIIAAVASPNHADTLTELAAVRDRLPKQARETDAAPQAAQMAAARLEDATQGGVTAATQATRAASAKTPARAAAATGTLIDDAAKQADEFAEESSQVAAEIGASPVDVSMDVAQLRAARAIGGGLVGLLDTGRTMFDQSHLLGKAKMWLMFHDGMAARKIMDSDRRRALSEVWNAGKAIIPGTKVTYFDQAFRDLQAGKRGASPLHDQIETLLSETLPVADTSLLGAGVFRTAKGLPDESAFHYLNENFNQYDGLKGLQFDLEAAAKETGQRGGAFDGDFAGALADQWHQWDIADPKQFILDMQRLASKTYVDAVTSRAMIRDLTAAGLASTGPKAGMVPITASKATGFTAFLPKGLHVDPEVAWGLTRVNQMMNESMTLNGPLGKFVQEWVDPIQQAWKRAITVLRPGHHVRNAIGDFSQTFWAEGTAYMRQSSKLAFQLMQLKKEYQGVDLMAALAHLGQDSLASEGAIVTAGRFGQMSAKDLYASALKHGLLPDAKVIDDLALENPLTRTGSKESAQFSAALNKISFNSEGSKIGGVVHTVTEARDHYQRLQHFAQVVMKAQQAGAVDMGFRGMVKPKNVDELMRLAAEKVIKSHPDASLLTPFEYKYLRRVIPFYSWMRGALPFVIAHSLRYPGRGLVPAKASYNLAVAMGVHPDSLADPFPDDQLFPAFQTQSVQGPQFKVAGGYFSASPGFTMFDVPNSFLAGGTDSPQQSLLEGVGNMLNPAIRAPIELATGSKLFSQSEVRDASDYVDGMIPGVNYLAPATGVSVTGSLVSALRGQGLDATYNAAKGRSNGDLAKALGARNANVPEPTWTSDATQTPLAIWNYLTGSQTSNASKSSYINLAEIEARNREQKAATK